MIKVVPNITKQEYEKNPYAYWSAPKPLRGSTVVTNKLPDISDSPLWAKNVLPEILRNSKHDLCLDLGCGGGRYIGHASEHFTKVIGIDFSEYNIERAAHDFSRIGNIEFLLSSLADISPIETASVDFAYSAAVFLHMPNDIKRAALKELSRVLKPEGNAVLIEITPIVKGAFDCPDISTTEWQGMIKDAGLKLDSDTDANPFRKYKLNKI